MRFIDKMERKFGRYAIRGLMKYVIACYIIGYVPVSYTHLDVYKRQAYSCP